MSDQSVPSGRLVSKGESVWEDNPAKLRSAFASPGHSRRGDRSKRLALPGGQVTPLLIVGLGGFLGANARYLIGGWAAERFGVAFPYGTFLINLSGSFFIGLFLTLVTERFVVHPSARLFFAIGFLGAYTTFSTFTFETLALLQSRAYLFAAANLLGSMLLGLVAVTLGVVVGRLV